MKSPEDRLLSFRLIDTETNCWLFTGYRDKWGYGRFSFLGRPESAHRVAAILWLDYTPESTTSDGEELHVLHHCNVRACFNPEHLYIGTSQDNTDDAKVIGSLDKLDRRILTMEQAREIRARYEQSDITIRELAREYGTSDAVMNKLLRGQTYIERL